MASVIDTHPQKQQIIDAIIAGKSLRYIANSVTPPVQHTVVQRYKRDVVLPSISVASKILAERKLSDEQQQKALERVATADATKAVIAANPVVQRLSAKWERMDKSFGKLVNLKDLDEIRTLVLLERAETDALRFQAELAGQIGSGPTVNQLVVVIPGWQAGDQAPEPSIDVTSESID